MTAFRLTGLGAGVILLAATASAADRREYIVQDAFPGWEAKAAAAVVDVRCRSVRNPTKEAFDHCERAVAQWLGLEGPLVVIDAPALASGRFTEEERAAIVLQTDRLEAQRQAEIAARQVALERAMKAAVDAKFRADEHAISGMAPTGPKTHAELMRERAEARAKRLAERQHELTTRINRNNVQRGKANADQNG